MGFVEGTDRRQGEPSTARAELDVEAGALIDTGESGFSRQ
ncbi:hypothetical protein MMSP_2318 [Mycobacterium sp. 012931]|nr:hypothetical protein MMSP_2318 [Mycobacterium sp. 012931]